MGCWAASDGDGSYDILLCWGGWVAVRAEAWGTGALLRRNGGRGDDSYIP